MSEHFFNVQRPVDVASDSITSTAYSSPEKDSVIPVSVGNNSYNVVAWGNDNQLPYKLNDMVERNSVLSQDKFFNVLTCYSRGIEYMDLSTRGSKHPMPTADKNVKRFLMRNNMKRFFAEQITDLKYYFFCVSVVILSRDRSKIVRIVHKDACHVRFEQADVYGRVKNILYADWKDDNSPSTVEVIPLLDEYDPLGDLLARTGKERDDLGVFRKSPMSQTKFAIVCRMPTPGASYYPIPYWSATLRDGWYDIYGYLTAAKKAKLKNGQSIRYHVEINDRFWENLAREKGISMNDSPEFEAMRDEFLAKLRDNLAGSKNSDKMMWSGFSTNLDGHELHDIKVNVIDTTKAGNEYNDDVAEVSNVLAYSDNVHPNLAGATPGKSQMNNSGSDKRELFTMKQALETMPHDMMMVAHNLVIYYNGWDDKVYPDMPMILLTTLDQNTDAKQVSTNNGGQKDGHTK